MKRAIQLLVFLVLSAVFGPLWVATASEIAGQNALSWLSGRQNADGSWGGDLALRPLYTSAAVDAMRSFSKQNAAYYAGIAWMENHHCANMDLSGRKIQSLMPHGDAIQPFVDAIVQARWSSTEPSAGWGLSGFYRHTPIDTARALFALSNTGWSDFSSALAFVQSHQNPDGGWGFDTAAGSDPLTTAIVVQALCRYESLYPQVGATILSAEAYLVTHVDAADDALLHAEAALALLPNGRQAAKVNELIDALENDQNPSGDWEDAPYTTARAVQAMAAALGKDPDAQAALSDVCDAMLRGALNSGLGKNAADALTLGEMQGVTSLSAAGTGITNLCGLDDAANLTYADLRNNQITSLQALVGLTQLETVLLDGNPLSTVEDADGDGFSDLAELQAGSNPLNPESVPSGPATPVPAVNLFGLLLTAAVLAAMGYTKKGKTVMRQRQHSAFMLAAACISSALLMVGIAAHPAAARDKSVSQPLPAQTLDQIKGVGQALLQAKRAYQSPDEVNALRQDMDQLHGLLEKLTQPKRGDTLRLETANGRAEDGASRDPWREKRAGDLNQLRRLADRVQQRSNALAAKAKASKGELQAEMTPNSCPRQPALTRLMRLKNELDQALALPAMERQKRLMEIKHNIKIGRQPRLHATDTLVETPTLKKRTKHRPLGQ